MKSDAEKLKLFTGRANPQLAQKICDYLDIPMGRGRTEAISRWRADRQGRRRRARPRLLRRAADVSSGERASDGIDDLDRLPEARQRRARDGGHSLFRLRPAGSQRRRPHADHGKARGESAGARRRRSRRVGRSARRAGAGIFRHSRGSSQCRAGDDQVAQEPEAGQPRVRLAGRRQRQTRPALRQRHRRRDLHHRQASQEAAARPKRSGSSATSKAKTC